ncbi:phosphoribosyltransferase family protein [Flavihumibacter petaseus]|uniref:Putative uracil phosphoribosyltransferase n=1 Tax=Flavihumibacter petaseus NBRC 106054 TaxID=1220578 RepID=A0A0E9N670_9BACT|nr:phosphoribosyltransferase family protein [Flavihumibacter petaseus]GAO45324.1 putative uracil phosphoribosyltransferase [Flavihumibacter petaseus NBRC 106054]
MTTERKYILDAPTAAVKMERMAYEIAEQLVGEDAPVILAGIRDNGVVMAKILQELLRKIASLSTSIIEISLDKRNPGLITIDQEISIDNKIVILVDDVVNSGKTLLYALKPFLEQHPRRIQILTLIERTHKAFPLKADYVGISIATTLQEHIYVEVENHIISGAYLE